MFLFVIFFFCLPAVVTAADTNSFAGVKDVASFASLPHSFATMTYIVMFSNWPMFMDAAGKVGSVAVAYIFFYTFKIVGFYYMLPVKSPPLPTSVCPVPFSCPRDSEYCLPL